MIKGVLASIAIVLVLVLSVAITSSEASEETYRTEYGDQWIKLISSSELEYHPGHATFLCKYSNQKGSLRVIMTVLGTQQVLYFRRTSEGLVSEKGMTFFNPAALAENRQQAALAERARLEREQAERDRTKNAVKAKVAARRVRMAKAVGEWVSNDSRLTITKDGDDFVAVEDSRQNNWVQFMRGVIRPFDGKLHLTQTRWELKNPSLGGHLQKREYDLDLSEDEKTLYGASHGATLGPWSRQ